MRSAGGWSGWKVDDEGSSRADKQSWLGAKGRGRQGGRDKKAVAKRQGRQPMRRRRHRDREGLLGMDGDMTGSLEEINNEQQLCIIYFVRKLRWHMLPGFLLFARTRLLATLKAGMGCKLSMML